MLRLYTDLPSYIILLQINKTEMLKEFIEGWDLVQVLEEGTYGEVMLLVLLGRESALVLKVAGSPHPSMPLSLTTSR